MITVPTWAVVGVAVLLFILALVAITSLFAWFGLAHENAGLRARTKLLQVDVFAGEHRAGVLAARGRDPRVVRRIERPDTSVAAGVEARRPVFTNSPSGEKLTGATSPDPVAAGAVVTPAPAATPIEPARLMPEVLFDPGYVDWNAYLDGVYTPSPALAGLPDYDSFWRNLGGQGWGFGGEIERQRKEAEALKGKSLRLTPVLME